MRLFPPIVLLLVARPAAATNVLLVVLDDVGRDKVGAYRDEVYGSEPVYLPDTPTLDALAGMGLRFTDVWASPVCSPTRAGILTGLYGYQSDVGNTVSRITPELSGDYVTLAETLTDPTATPVPSEVGLFGKWHLGVRSEGGADWEVAGDVEDAPNPALQGFSAYAGSLGGEPEDYYEWLRVEWPVDVGGGVVGAHVDWDTTWTPDRTLTDTTDWLLGRSGPWVAIVALNAAHTDDTGMKQTYEADDLAPDGRATDRTGDGALNNAELHADLVEQIDGRLADFLDDLAAADPRLLADTLIVVVGDNGSPPATLEGGWEPAGERLDAGKDTVYESGVRVPLLMARGCDWLDAADGALDHRVAGYSPACRETTLPMVTPGLAVTAPVQTLDLYATILGLADATPPRGTPSDSLVPCLLATADTAATCGSPPLRGRVRYTEIFERPWDETSDFGTIGLASSGEAAVRRGRFKLLAGIDVDAGGCVRYEAYDLAADPMETDDLLAGGNKLTALQVGGIAQLRGHLRGTLAPDWLPTTECP